MPKPTEKQLDEAQEQCEAMLAAARERWPEMIEQPYIVPVSPGTMSIEVAVMEPIGELPYTNTMIRRLWTENIQQAFRYVRIDLERVGAHRLGYSAELGYLAIGQ